MTLFHGSTGLIGDAFDAGTWCTQDIVDAIYYAQRIGGNRVYVFVGKAGFGRQRKYFRLKEPRAPDYCLKL